MSATDHPEKFDPAALAKLVQEVLAKAPEFASLLALLLAVFQQKHAAVQAHEKCPHDHTHDLCCKHIHTQLHALHEAFHLCCCCCPDGKPVVV